MTLEQKIIDIRFSGEFYSLSDYSFFEATGEDVDHFFQGQLTNDVFKLENGKGHYSCRLDRTGRLKYFLIVIRESKNHLFFCVKNSFKSLFQEEMDKFIIMDDVVLTQRDCDLVVATGLKQTENVDNLKKYQIPFYLESSSLFIKSRDQNWPSSFSLKDLEELNVLWFFNGMLEDINVNFVNESVLNEYGISYKKGCFLGQETAAKIENNRGAAKYPVLLKFSKQKLPVTSNLKVSDTQVTSIRGQYYLGEDTLISFLAPRHLRVKNLKVDVEIDGKILPAIIDYHPFFKSPDVLSKASEFFEYGVNKFQEDDLVTAEKFIRAAIALDIKNPEYYESLGVLLGRMSRFEEAIELMDQLSSIDENSVMAHTNKSLYLMKLGRIEEAEEEKGKATVKSFSMFGQEAKSKKAAEEALQKENAELARKKQMFLQVLEIDPEDEIANFGLGDVKLKEKNYEESLKHFELVLQTNNKHSQTYLKMGQALEALKRKLEAREVYLKGIEIASRQGELMPANQMQERLLNL